jgi:bacteriocin biosynthesis cyclodehydratase domain-containing protein
VHPRLKPALRRLWRDTATLQLGVAGPHALVLHGLSAADRAVLALLDGSRDVAAVLADAEQLGIERDSATALLDTLERAGALDDGSLSAVELGEDDRQRLAPDVLSLSLRHPRTAVADVLERRQRAVVAVHGAGRVGAGVAMLLAAAGVGTLACMDDEAMRFADISPGGLPRLVTDSRGAVTALRASRFARTARATTDRPAETTLALLTPASSVPLPEIVTSVRDEPHLYAAVQETTAVVGPLVVPGRTPCLRCLSLARSDRDPHWPLLSAQLVGEQRREEACDVALASLAASLTALQVLAFIDGTSEPATAGVVLEYDLATAALRRRSVQAHPLCGCGAADADVLTAQAS